MSEYFLPEIKKANSKAKIQKHSVPLDSGIGFITHDENIFKMKKFFHEQNVDNMIRLWYDIALEFNLVSLPVHEENNLRHVSMYVLDPEFSLTT